MTMDLNAVPLSLDEFNRFKSGDEKVFKKIFDFYRPLLYRKVRRVCASDLDVEEIMQEIFVQLFLKRDSIPSAEAIFPFLFLVAKRMAITFFRKELSRQKYQLSHLTAWDELSDELERKLAHRDLDRILQEIVSRLPPQQQLVFNKSKIEEMSYAEISEEIGISKNTVRNHLVAACQFVRLKLDSLLFIFFLIKNIF
ncbi:RNA polymerase sigma factor [Sphingobacterium thalpophilum]|uniref:RNA polymerase sigma factor n=2 Tax=Sphingobacterium thalpophilum TaxID=259 RepID=A0A4U9U653_9SPHI|nr:sigma-70 family RNA polymerase sigma factor [Sphingobacterium thalpophilum]VTR28380.1 RNA polymerase sigma factor [Sphingobacterium thalpophilum]